MPDLWMDVDTALSEVPVNIMPLLDDTDYKTRETAVAYNAAGMDLVWNFVLPDGTFTQTAVTPTTAGDYDWTHQGDAMYTIEIPASGGASINNDTEGIGWFTGVATGVLPWRGPTIGFRASGLNDALIESAYSTTRGLAGTALPAAAANAAGGLPISNAGSLDLDLFLGRITGNVALASVLGALTDAAADGDPTTADTLMQYVKQLINVLVGTAGVVTFPAAAAPGNGVNLAEVLRSVYDDTNELQSTGVAPHVLIDTTIATVTTQTSFTLTAGSDQDDAYNGQSIVLYDASNSDFPCVRRVMDYVGSTKRVTLDTAPNFTIAASDGVKIFVSGAFASIKGATEVTDILIDDGSDPVEGVEVWITTGAAGTVTIWNGVTDALGVPKDVNDENPFLDPGTYYIWAQHGGYSFSNPYTLTVGSAAPSISGTAVSGPGSISMQTIIDDIQVDLNDTGAATWAEADLLQWLNDAIRDYSLLWPRQRTGTITAVADDHKYDLPEDFMDILTVEYPAGNDPPTYLNRHQYVDDVFWSSTDYYAIVYRRDQDVDDEIWISATPAGGETITIEYLAYHPHNLTAGGFCSVPIEHHHLLRLYVAWRATLYLQSAEQQNPTSNSSLLMSMLAQNASALRSDYLQDVARRLPDGGS